MSSQPIPDPIQPAGVDDARSTEPDDAASRAVLAALRTAVQRIEAAEAAARAGSPEGVHRLRTSCRRLRSELQAFGKLLEGEQGGRLIAELQWLGAAVGEVRDLDVLRERLEKGESEEDRLALKPLFDRLADRHTRAARAMKRTLKGERFEALLTAIRGALDNPPLAPKASKPCRKVLPPLVAGAWKRLRKDSEELRSDSPDQAFHDLRKRAKRARYTTELIAPTLGSSVEKQAKRLIELARTTQDVLGAHQDAVVAVDEVEAMLAEAGLDDAFRKAAGELLERLRREADESRDAFLAELQPKLEKKKNRGRLKAGG
ncbi:CHAD domain-containing protein [Paludisphaera rhizosphaerae]|uniref:CHAD domain-containing protein n=1 Tax=Paludisphaera rhizosphaerae TaxID=2711216 RepID=UPI0013EC8CE4|nr:CHAD domain-containing protein [Paludisphaera rhizosphaerae]